MGEAGTWFERQLEAGYLKKRRRPKGEEVASSRHLAPNVRYRIPLDTTGHYVDPKSIVTEPMFRCGRSIWPTYEESVWYVISGAEAVFGAWYVLVDERKGSACADCNRYRKLDLKHAERVAAEQRKLEKKYGAPKSPLSTSEVRRLTAQHELRDRKLGMQAARLAEEFDGEVLP